jgi:hypothetical protein
MAKTHCNSKTHFETEPLPECWVNKNPTRVESPDEHGCFGSDSQGFASNTLEWFAFYDKEDTKGGQPTNAALRAQCTFPKLSEKLGKKPAGLAMRGKYQGYGYNPQPTASKRDVVLEFVFQAETWELDPVSHALL